MATTRNYEEKRRVLYINQTAKISGAERSLLSFFEKIDRKLIEPILLLPEDGPLLKETEKIGIETIVLPYLIKFGESHSLFKLSRILRAVYMIVEIIKRKKIDIVHSNSPRAGFIGGLSARLALVPSVIHVRDIHQSPFSNYFKASILDALSDKIIAVSNATKISIGEKRRSLIKKVDVVYNGIDIEKIDSMMFRDFRKEIGVDNDVKLIASIGILHPVKGHDTLIKSIPLVKEKFPLLKALIVGDCFLEKEREYRDELKNLAESVGVLGDVIFTGFREDIFNVLKAIDIFVLPSKYPDPFPRALLEASAMKKPIIATRVGGIPEIIKDGFSGILIEPEDHLTLANAIILLLEKDELAHSLAFRSRKILEENFTIEKHLEKILYLYFEIKTKK